MNKRSATFISATLVGVLAIGGAVVRSASPDPRRARLPSGRRLHVRSRSCELGPGPSSCIGRRPGGSASRTRIVL